MPPATWITFIITLSRVALNILAVIINFNDYLRGRRLEGADTASDLVSESRKVLVWSELCIVGFLVGVFVVAVLDMLYQAARFYRVGAVDRKNNLGEAVKLMVTAFLEVGSFSLLSFMPSVQRLMDLPHKATNVRRYIAKKMCLTVNPLKRERKWNEMSHFQACLVFSFFSFLQIILFALGIAALFVKISQLRRIAEKDLPDWNRNDYVLFLGFANNIASITDAMAERAQGVLYVIFAGSDGKLDNIEWANLNSWLNLTFFRVVVTHGFVYGFAMLTQITAKEYQIILMKEKEAAELTAAEQKALNIADRAERMSIFAKRTRNVFSLVDRPASGKGTATPQSNKFVSKKKTTAKKAAGGKAVAGAAAGGKAASAGNKAAATAKKGKAKSIFTETTNCDDDTETETATDATYWEDEGEGEGEGASDMFELQQSEELSTGDLTRLHFA